MRRLLGLLSMCFCVVVAGSAIAQDAGGDGKVDYARDIQPLLRQNCASCHGEKVQNGGFRVDRRSSLFKNRRMTPGSSENSMMFHRVQGNEFGQQMPPMAELKPAEVDVIKRWIDQGAPWPDALANEADLPPLEPKAIAAVEMLHRGETVAFMKAMKAQPGLLNARGPEGSTPFMYAVLYTNAATVGQLLAMGANVNAHNDEGATALMWGVHDASMARVLLEHGAEVNVVSSDFRTPLMIAARQAGNAAVVKMLLDKGANPNPNRRAETASSPLTEAATAGDAANFEMLWSHGAVLKGDAQNTLSMAVAMRCDRCVDLIAAKVTDKDVYTGSLQDEAVMGDTHAVKMMLDHGADVKASDPLGRTALMYAVASDVMSLETVKMLVEHGADVNAKSKHSKGGDTGVSVLEMAKRHGNTAVVAYLKEHGAKEVTLTPVTLNPRFKNEIRGAIQDSLPLLQTADMNFSTKSGCVSCHNNSLTAMTMSAARKQGMRVDETTATAQVKANVEFLGHVREILHQGFLIPVGDYFSENMMGYILMGLSAEGYKGDLSTDAVAMHILWRQTADGSWRYPVADTRQPLCLDFVGQTALAMRGMQLYTPAAEAWKYKQAIARGAAWLATAPTHNNDDLSWKLTGLAWAGTNKPAMQKTARELLAAQKSDGGWSDLPSMESTAYATGKSLVALRLAGTPVSDAVYKRGVAWLLSNQQKDGSWYVQTRAMAFQPSFDAGFPHGHNQWISAAGSNWAALALAMSLPEQGKLRASR